MPVLRYHRDTTRKNAMRQAALKEIPEEEPRSYVERIRELVERGDVRGARALAAEAAGLGIQEEGFEQWQRVLAPAKVLGVGLVSLEPDRSREERWLEENAQAYRNQWVALEGDTLLARAPTFSELMKVLDEIKPVRRPLAYRFD
jgi:hypothetical protein